MAVRMRLMRMGKTKQPVYRVVVMDQRAPRDGRYIEQIGRYDARQEPSLVEIDNEMRAKLPQMNKAYLDHNHVFLGSGATESTDIFTTFPLKKVEDLKGHKIGASGATTGEMSHRDGRVDFICCSCRPWARRRAP